jgi:hypothetical protein
MSRPEPGEATVREGDGVVSYLRGFAPWIIYAVLSSVDWRIGMCAAAGAAAVLVANQRRQHDLDLLTGATFAFFGVMAIIALAAPHSGLHHWTPALSAGTLAVIAAGSLAARRPFTAAIARRTVPEQFWATPTFVRSNDIITAVWAAAFTASATASALIIHLSPGSSPPLIAAQVIGFLIPFAFTKTYTERLRAASGRAATA